MKLAIMQPYFFPYIGYFSLIENTDFFVFFDTPQYIKKGWINRNRILGAKEESVFFTVPIEKIHRDTPINQVRISNHSNWREKILGQFSVYKRRAPFYEPVMELLREVIDSDAEYVSELAINSVIKTCEYLDMDLQYDIYSKMEMEAFEVNAPDEWALNITRNMGYDTYVNPPGGKSFFETAKYEQANIQLEFLTQEIAEYNQRKQVFMPGLSILDVLMFCKSNEVVQMMNYYKIERGK